MKNRICMAVLGAYLSVSTSAQGSDGKSGQRVEFDHLAGVSQSEAISAKPGEVITIVIKNTCPDRFEYDLGGIPLSAPEAAFAESKKDCTLKDHTLTQVHDDRFGGYYLAITPISGPGSRVMADDNGAKKELKELTFLVGVTTVQWDIAFAGGFTIADIVDPVFASQDNGMMQNVVIRDRGAEDDVSLGLAGMIHLYHRKRPHWAATFGLSTGSGNDLAYMLGGSYRFGDKGALTLGYMWAPVDRLPAGLSVGDTIADSNSLANLQSRTEGGVFLGISYSFISGVKDIFEKPFKGSAPVVPGGASQAPVALAARAGGGAAADDGGGSQDNDQAGADGDQDSAPADDEDADD